MPRKRQSIEAQRAARTRATAKWRQRVAAQRNQGPRADLRLVNSPPILGALAGAEEGEREEGAAGKKQQHPQPSPYEANEAGDAPRDDDSDTKAAHEAGEAAEAANPPFSPYEAGEADEAGAEDAPYQFEDDDSNIEAAHEAVNTDIDTDTGTDTDRAGAESQSQGEVQSDAYNSSTDTDSISDSDDSYEEGDDEATTSVSSYEAAADEDAPQEAAEPGPEAQLQQELRQSEDAKLNLPLQLGLHLLNSFSCGGHADSHEQHRAAQEEEENHWSLEDLNQATQRLPDILNSPDILPHDSEHRQRSYDWARIFEGRSQKQHSDADESSLANSSNSSDSDSRSDKPATVCLACSEQPARTNEV